MTLRNISINQASIEAAVTIAAGAAVSFGFIPAADKDSVVSAADGVVMGVFALVAALRLLGGYLVHKKVTPVADPKNDAGEPLIPDPSVAAPTFDYSAPAADPVIAAAAADAPVAPVPPAA